MRKPVGCHELPREGRPQTLNATVPTASNRKLRPYQSEESNHEPRAGKIKDTTDGTRKSRRPTMPSFSSLRQRLPPPLHSTGTVYTHLTTTRRECGSVDGQLLRRRPNQSHARSLLTNYHTTKHSLTGNRCQATKTNLLSLFEKSWRRSRPPTSLPHRSERARKLT